MSVARCILPRDYYLQYYKYYSCSILVIVLNIYQKDAYYYLHSAYICIMSRICNCSVVGCGVRIKSI